MASTGDGAMAFTDALQTLKGVEWARKEKAMTSLLRLLRNIFENPDNAKFRTLKLENPKLSTDVFSVPGCLELLFAVGFQEDARVLKLEARCSVACAFHELQTFADKEVMSQQRYERDMRIAKARADGQVSKHSRSIWKKTLKPEEASAHEVENSVPQEIHVNLQSLAGTTNVSVAEDATVGDLRSLVASQRQCTYDQVMLSLLSPDGQGVKLCRDDSSLRACGVTDGCAIAAALRKADEFLEETSFIKGRCPRAAKYSDGAVLDGMAKDESWKFTQEILHRAEKAGVVSTKQLQSLKRQLHIGDLSAKEVRDLVMMEAPQADAEFHDIKERFAAFARKAQTMEKRMKIAEEQIQYSEMIARDNRNGLIDATRKSFSS